VVSIEGILLKNQSRGATSVRKIGM
jgi:hypothetical protein